MPDSRGCHKYLRMKIALIGYGKMGKAIEEIALSRHHEIVLRITSSTKQEMTAAALRKADIAIEFTTPEDAFINISKCFEAGIPVVCGTTGWLDKFEEIKELCLQYNSALLYASNFSVGVNIFFEVNKRLADLMSGRLEYDVSIRETHHTHKKDAPSGTAISLAEQIMEALPRKEEWVNSLPAKASDIYIESLRVDPVPGTHTVMYTSQVDDIGITHTAHNRTGFATGAVLAAEYIKDKKGNFSMKDVLGM